MKHFCDEWIHEWCQDNGWTDLIMERPNHYWAFPPGAVMPEPIPSDTMRLIKAQNGLSFDEKWWSTAAVVVALVSTGLTYALKCPMPLVLAFAFAAIAMGKLEVEDF